MLFNKILKSAQSGFKQLPSRLLSAVKTFNDVRGKVQKALPIVEDTLKKSKRVYEEIVKPEISKNAKDKIERVFDFSNETVNKIKKGDAAIERTKQIFSE